VATTSYPAPLSGVPGIVPGTIDSVVGLSRAMHIALNLHLTNPLDPRGNHSATSNNMKLVHWPLMGGLLHLVQRGGDWAGP